MRRTSTAFAEETTAVTQRLCNSETVSVNNRSIYSQHGHLLDAAVR